MFPQFCYIFTLNIYVYYVTSVSWYSCYIILKPSKILKCSWFSCHPLNVKHAGGEPCIKWFWNPFYIFPPHITSARDVYVCDAWPHQSREPVGLKDPWLWDGVPAEVSWSTTFSYYSVCYSWLGMFPDTFPDSNWVQILNLLSIQYKMNFGI